MCKKELVVNFLSDVHKTHAITRKELLVRFADLYESDVNNGIQHAIKERIIVRKWPGVYQGTNAYGKRMVNDIKLDDIVDKAFKILEEMYALRS